MKVALFNIVAALVSIGINAIGGAASSLSNATAAIDSRSANTCADSAETVTFIQEFNTQLNAFALTTSGGWAAGSTISPTANWFYSGEVFLGWDKPDPQGLTTGLWLFFNPTTSDFAVALAEANGNAPPMPGFTPQGVAGFVYSNQVCGSVPLLGASNAGAGSHWYTTKSNDHAQLLTNAGWADDGTVAWVLPL